MSCWKSNFMSYLLFYLSLILVFYFIEQGLYQYWFSPFYISCAAVGRYKRALNDFFEYWVQSVTWSRHAWYYGTCTLILLEPLSSCRVCWDHQSCEVFRQSLRPRRTRRRRCGSAASLRPRSWPCSCPTAWAACAPASQSPSPSRAQTPDYSPPTERRRRRCCACCGGCSCGSGTPP